MNAHLTARQRQVLQLASEGLSNEEIAARIGLTDRHAVSSVFETVYRKLGVRQAREQAILIYLRGYDRAA